jgi:hypothetical protein
MTLQAPLGQFLLVELEPGLHREWTDGLVLDIAELPGVSSVKDLAVVPIELLTERILLRIHADQWPKGTRPRPGPPAPAGGV